MGRSVTFVIEAGVSTRVRISENLDGTMSIELDLLGAGKIGDLRALFFDLNDLAVDDALAVYGDAGVSDCAVIVEGVDRLGRAATVRGGVVNEFGDFDVGIEFGPDGPAPDDIRSTGFTLAHDTAALTLDMFDLADFGLRHAARDAEATGATGGPDGSPRRDGLRGGDPLEMVEPETVSARLLANDTRGGVLAVIDVDGVRRDLRIGRRHGFAADGLRSDVL